MTPSVRHILDQENPSLIRHKPFRRDCFGPSLRKPLPTPQALTIRAAYLFLVSCSRRHRPIKGRLDGYPARPGGARV